MLPLLLVPSPLVGPATWDPVATLLQRRGHDARVVDTSSVRGPLDLVAAVADAAGRDEVALVTHSNAGLAVPVLGDRISLGATVFVDAALPTDAGSTPMAPPALLDLLDGLADEDGLLPPWTEWWDDLSGVFPDPGVQALVEATRPRLPLSYFTAHLPVPDGWTDRPAAYLAFGETYAAELAFAVGHGWPTASLEGGHLHQLHDPGGVAAEVLSLIERLRA